MARAFGLDLRKQVIDAIEAGASTREAARRSAIGGSTAGAWHRTRGSGHHASGGRDAPGNRARFRACIASVHGFFIKRALSYKKNTAHAAEQQRWDVLAARERWFEGQPDLGPASPDLHRRDRGHYQDGPPSRSVPARRAMPDRGAPWPLEDNHPGRRSRARGDRSALDPRRPDERQGLARVCPAGSRTGPIQGRQRHRRHPASPQSRRRPRGNRACGRAPALSRPKRRTSIQSR